MTLRDAVLEVQKIGFEHGFTIVIVGGAITRLIGKKTKIKKIDEKGKIIYLENAENPGIARIEDSKTNVDIDGVVFSNDIDPFTKETKEKFAVLFKNLKNLRKVKGFPAISIEPVLYHPIFAKPNIFTQFVSSVESYLNGEFLFRLGTVRQSIQKESLEFWTYKLSETESLITLSPIAIQKRYLIRGFSIKPKDKEKIFGKNSFFGHFVSEFNDKTNGKYLKYFDEWNKFARLIETSKGLSMQIKRGLWKIYWNSIGNYLAHGTGLIGKILLPLGNTFFAGK